jgi:2-octaprenyl-3-methyl-6-methoxy-1,4-benzoquinol hydroxylase
MSRQAPLDVVVVGAGVVGAAAALAFARDGRRVALVESRQPSPWSADNPDLRVYALAPDNAALLGRLGAWSAIAGARLQSYRGMRVWDAGGGDELVFDADRLGRPELGWIVEHGLLVDRLWSALPAAGVAVHCPDAAEALSQDSDSATLQLESGLRLHARLVIAADGGDSRLRTLAGVDAPCHDYRQRGLVAYIGHQAPHRATCWQRFLPGGPLAFLPFVDDEQGPRSSIVWSLPEDEAGRLLAVNDEVFLDELARAFDGPLGALRSVSRRAAFPLRRQLASTQVAGRVVLVGDAAHVVHPLAGQGVNLGLRDVGALQAVLGGVRGGDIGSAAKLQRWGRRRRSDNTVSAYAFEGINRLFSNDAVLPVLARGRLLGLAGSLPPLNRALWRHAAGL